MSTIETRWAKVLVVASGAALLLSGCSLISGLTGQTQRDPSGTVTASNDDADVFSIRVGDCFNDPTTNDDGTVSEVPVVPCTDSHSYEAYKSIIIPDGDGTYPGTDAVLAQADSACFDAFEAFVGVPLDSSELSYSYYYPTEDTWASLDDREILCLVVDPAGPVTGSLEGAGR